MHDLWKARPQLELNVNSQLSRAQDLMAILHSHAQVREVICFIREASRHSDCTSATWRGWALLTMVSSKQPEGTKRCK